MELDGGPIIVDSFGEMSLRLGLAALIGLLLGLERELRGHDAGLRTNAIVALSSAMVTVSSLLMFDELKAHGADPDPLRVIQGVAQAIGFIAAGLIFVRRGDVLNLTTAANLWMAAAIGIVAGLGQYTLLIVGSVLALLLLTSEGLFAKLLRKKRERGDDDSSQK